jgi:hypothetical protein
MPQYFIAVLRPLSGDTLHVDADMGADIDALNNEMHAVSARIFAGGLGRPTAERTERLMPSGDTDANHPLGPHAHEHLDGFWIIEAADLAEAREWGRKAARACRAAIEVRQFL